MELLETKEFVGSEAVPAIWLFELCAENACFIGKMSLASKVVNKSELLNLDATFGAPVLVVEWGRLMSERPFWQRLNDLSLQIIVLCSDQELCYVTRNSLIENINIHWVGKNWAWMLVQNKIKQAQKYNELALKVQNLLGCKQSFFKEIQSRSLASLQAMGEGLAHEISQPLFIIQGFLDKIRRELSVQSVAAMSENFERIFESVSRIDRIVKHFKVFSQQQENRMMPLSINETVDRALNLKSISLQSHAICVERVLSDQDLRFLGDDSRIEKALVNIISNSCEAIMAAKRDDGRIIIQTFRSEEKVTIEIIDNGIGVKPENLNKLADPFFSTKLLNDGMGMGLTEAFGIISAHGGGISYESEKGKGTICRIEFQTGFA